MKTKNGGDSWEKFDFQKISTSFISQIIKDIFFVNEQTGYIVTDYYNIYRTKNGGLTWDTLKYGVDHWGLTNFGAYGNTLIAVGGSGDIYKFFSGNNVTRNAKINNNKGIIECQLYPNPASERIFLNLSLPEQKIEMKLNSANGQALFQKKIFFNGINPIEIEIPGFYTGLAILQIIGKNFNHSEKIVIQK